jgi:hypothetical protein
MREIEKSGKPNYRPIELSLKMLKMKEEENIVEYFHRVDGTNYSTLRCCRKENLQ